VVNSLPLFLTYHGEIQNVFMVCFFIEFIVSCQAQKYELAPTQNKSCCQTALYFKKKLFVHSYPCSKALGPTKPSVKWVTWLFQGVRLPKSGSDHLHSFSSEVKKEQGYTINPLLCLHGFYQGDLHLHQHKKMAYSSRLASIDLNIKSYAVTEAVSANS
jgi:hypothetical protein